MILVAVIDNSVVEKTYKTEESFADIKGFLEVIHPEAQIVQANSTTGFADVGFSFDGEKFVTEAV